MTLFPTFSWLFVQTVNKNDERKFFYISIIKRKLHGGLVPLRKGITMLSNYDLIICIRGYCNLVIKIQIGYNKHCDI